MSVSEGELAAARAMLRMRTGARDAGACAGQSLVGQKVDTLDELMRIVNVCESSEPRGEAYLAWHLETFANLKRVFARTSTSEGAPVDAKSADVHRKRSALRMLASHDANGDADGPRTHRRLPSGDF